ncbi:MAG: RNA polymerase sigma factor [Bacteroidota bacterium]|jgi:RNA polymerase sigma-70 factor (ECF subfamily)
MTKETHNALYHMDTLSDEELTVQFRNGHLNAGAKLYTKHKDTIYSFCFRMVGDAEAAKDATQETFLKMMTKIHSLQQGMAFRSWLFAIARNEVLIVLRREKIVPMERLEDDEPVFDASNPLSIALEGELSEHLQRAVGALKPAYREAYLLRETEGLSYEEIARTTDSTVSAVKSKLFKSRVALNTMLTPYMERRKL